MRKRPTLGGNPYTGKAYPVLRDGEPCSHRGCLSHISHPCEGCGRIGGRSPSAPPREEATAGEPWAYRCDRCGQAATPDLDGYEHTSQFGKPCGGTVVRAPSPASSGAAPEREPAREQQLEADAALVRRVMDVTGATQAEVGRRLGKTQGAVSWTATKRSPLSKLEREELHRWLAQHAAPSASSSEAGEQVRAWRRAAMEAMRYLNAEQIAAVANASGLQAHICASAPVRAPAASGEDDYAECVRLLTFWQKTHREWAEHFEQHPEIEAAMVATGQWDGAAEQRRIEAQHGLVLRVLSSQSEEIAALREPRCHFACEGRGDCQHAVGLPAVLDETTTDEYGKPPGWCWWCWNAHQLAALREERDAFEQMAGGMSADLAAFHRKVAAAIDPDHHLCIRDDDFGGQYADPIEAITENRTRLAAAESQLAALREGVERLRRQPPEFPSEYEQVLNGGFNAALDDVLALFPTPPTAP